MPTIARIDGDAAPEHLEHRLRRGAYLQHLLDREANCINVTPCVPSFSLQLLGRHVPGRTDYDAGLSHGKRCGAIIGVRGWFSFFGESKIQNLRADASAGLDEHYVMRLEVAMKDPMLMGVIQAFENSACQLQRLLKRKRPFPKPVCQGLTFEVLHDEEVGAVLRPYVEEQADIWMIQFGDGARLLLETGGVHFC